MQLQHNDRMMESFSLQRVVSRGLAVLLVACCMFMAAGVRCAAQDLSTGSLNVTVVDPEGAFIPGATLVLKDLETNDVHTGTTKGAGSAVIPYLNPANYSLIVSKAGFNSSQYAKVTIQTNQVTNLSVILKVGSASDTVTVS